MTSKDRRNTGARSEWVPVSQPGQQNGPGVLTIARGVALGIGMVVAVLFLLAQCQKQDARSDYLDCITGDRPQVCVDPDAP